MAPKENTAKRHSLKSGLAFSLLIHAALLSLLFYFIYDEVLRPAGEGAYSFVAVSLVGGTQAASPSFVRGGKGEAEIPSPRGMDQTPGAAAEFSGGENGTSEVLREIRSQIERTKFYPLIARRQKIEGSPVVEFQINNDGSVQNVELKQTSGSELLDEAAKLTVQQAQPFPYYPQPVALSIHYALSGKP